MFSPGVNPSLKHTGPPFVGSGLYTAQLTELWVETETLFDTLLLTVVEDRDETELDKLELLEEIMLELELEIKLEVVAEDTRDEDKLLAEEDKLEFDDTIELDTRVEDMLLAEEDKLEFDDTLELIIELEKIEDLTDEILEELELTILENIDDWELKTELTLELL